jgi:putative restriction endonuclease
MFGGGKRYVETLDAILEFVEAHQSTTDELVDWHRRSFANMWSGESLIHH